MPDQVTYELRGYRAEWSSVYDQWHARKVYSPEEPVHGATGEEAIAKAKCGTNKAATAFFVIICYVIMAIVLISVGFALNSLFIGVSWVIPVIVVTPVGQSISRGLWRLFNG